MFENKKIRLRKVLVEDYLVYHVWRNDTEVMKTTSLELDQYTIHDTEEYIKMIVSSQNAKGYIIEEIETNQAIGIISLINIDYLNRNAELIIDIGEKSAWGKGFGKAAISLVQNYVFNELNLNRLYLQVFDFNNRAIHLYKKLGFVVEGTMRQTIYRFGKWHNTIMMSILKQEFKENEISNT